MDIRALLFDINGTLIDIETDEGLEEIYRSIGHFLTYQGIELHRWEVRDLYFEIMQQQRKTSHEAYPEWDAVQLWREIIRRTATDYTRSLPAEKLAQLPLFLAELHRGIARKRLRLFPGVKEALALLRPRYQFAAISNAQSAYATPELQAVGLLDYFQSVIISGDYGYCKPDVRLFQYALDALQVQPEQALFIGNDMYSDVFGSQQLGIKTIFFSPRPQNTDREIQPDYIIYNFAELPTAVNYFVESRHPTEGHQEPHCSNNS
jgi:putative hydrolase of the HAD superfamily